MVNSRVFAGNLLIQIVSRAAAVLMGLLSVGILSRALGDAGFGEYTTAFTYLQFFGVLVDFGLTLTLVVMISEPGANESRIVSNVFTFRLILGLIFYSLAPLSALFLPKWSETVHTAIAIGAVAYLLSSCGSVLVGIFQKHAAMWRAGVAELLNRIVLVIFIAIFAATGASVDNMMLASVIANAALVVAMIWFARRFARVTLRIDRDVWADAIRRSWPIAISTLLNLVYLRGDILFLSWFRDSADVGIYGLAYRVIDVLTALPVMFMGLLLPPLVADWAAGKRAEFAGHLARSFNFFAILALPIMFGAQVVAEPLTVLIAGEDYRASGDVLRFLILAVFGVFMGGLYGHTVVALNKQKLMILGYAITAAISIVGYLYAIPAHGMWGAVWVTVGCETLIALFTFLMVWKTSGARPQLATLAKATLSSLIMYVVLLAVPMDNVIIHILFGCLVYGIAMLVTGGIKPETIRELMPRNIASHNR